MFIFLMIFGGFFTITGLLNIINDVDVTVSIIFLIIGILALSAGLLLNYYKQKKIILENGAKDIEDITKKYENRNIEREHSEEAYSTYLLLKDYPTSKNPHFETNTTYKLIIVSIQKIKGLLFALNKNSYPATYIDDIQLANLIINDFFQLDNSVEFECEDEIESLYSTIWVYVAYYLMVNESKIISKLSNKIKKVISPQKLIKNTRNRFVVTALLNARNSDDTFNKNIDLPDYPQILNEVATEMIINNPLETPFYEPR